MTPVITSSTGLKNHLAKHGTLTVRRNNPYTYGGSRNSTAFKVKLSKPVKGFKKVFEEITRTTIIAELEIPVGALIIYGDGGDFKLRASEAKVLRLETAKRTREVKVAFASHDKTFKYRTNTVAKPKKGFNSSYKTCAGGIHFYLSRRQAERY